MHPLLAVLTARPQLLVDHAQAYVALFQEDAALASAAWWYRARLQFVGLCCLCAALVLGGVALMLWAIVLPVNLHQVWALWLVPALPLAAGLVCWWVASTSGQAAAFSNLSRQIAADVTMLRAAGAP